MKKTIPLLGALGLTLMLAGCTDTSDKNARLLESMGMSNVKLGGYSWFACSDDDTFATRFDATGANGMPVSGTLCGGFMKGTTVRFD